MGEKINNKNFTSITTKLTGYFMLLILVFVLVMNLIFFISFVVEVNENNKTTFINQGNLISENLGIAFAEEMEMANFMSGTMGTGRGRNTNNEGNTMRGVSYNRISAIIRGISASSIYLLDMNNAIISENPSEIDIDTLLNSYNGELTYHRDQIDVFRYQDQLIAPVYVNGEQQYSMVMESPVHTLSTTLGRIAPLPIISSIFGALLVFFLSNQLLKRVTEPLIHITNITKEYSMGDYNSRTNIQQNDEIGELSSSIDIFGRELDEAKRRKEEEDLNQREFIASISHELRTPISIIQLSIEKLREIEKLTDDEVKECVDQLTGESAHLRILINDLIDLTKLENPSFKMEKESVNLTDVISDSIRSMRIAAGDKNIEIKTNIPPLIEVNGDYARLRQLFTILLDNAIKYSHKSGIVEVSYQDNLVSIKDYGVGIKAEDMERIFERYYRIDTENTTGSGLGLAIAREISSRHGFNMEVSSEVGKYTEFRIKL